MTPDIDAAPAKPRAVAAPRTTLTADRLSVPVTKDGRFSFTTMKAKVRARLRAALADPDLRAKLDIPEDAPRIAASAPSAAVSTDMSGLAAMLYDALGKLAAIAATKRGYAPKQAALLALDEEEAAALVPATAKVLTKYLPADLGKYTDEINLLIALSGVITAKAKLLRAAAATGPIGIVSPGAASQA